ncbi:hypothetical protein [Desulfobotulus alkaliphilus]|nr:hypothetical protein [Desulfobotulus alkaliphilus]
MPDPAQVFIAKDVSPDNIEKDVTLYPGCRISGSGTLLLSGSQVGEEGPVVMENVCTGRHVHLKGGFFKDAVFLEGAKAGNGSHVRGGSILEESASIAHSVGLKQTILFPWVTLGSLINFCDILMTGGTGPQDHSEVGSSYIHFNFTPDQDKATASLLGDVPSGVMLDKAPIFLGGQGGLVGPCRLAFGTVVAAGTLQRKDELRENRLIFGSSLRGGNVERSAGHYPGLRRILDHNFTYIANLHALEQWYRHVRGKLISPRFPEKLHHALLQQVKSAISERIKRLRQLKEKLAASARVSCFERNSLHSLWMEKADAVCLLLSEDEKQSKNETVLHFKKRFFDNFIFEKDYLSTLASLNTEQRDAGRRWLYSITEKRAGEAWAALTF